MSHAPGSDALGRLTVLYTRTNSHRIFYVSDGNKGALRAHRGFNLRFSCCLLVTNCHDSRSLEPEPHETNSSTFNPKTGIGCPLTTIPCQKIFSDIAMALAFYSSGHGAGKLPQSSSLIGTFKTAQTEDEQPIIPPNSLFDGLSPSPLEGTHVDGNKMPVIAECAVHLELLEAFLVLKEKIYTSNALDRTFAIRPEDKFVTQYRSRRKVRQPDKTFQTRRAVKWPIYIRLAAVRFLQWWGKLDGILKSYQDARCGTSSNELSSNMKSSQGLPNKVQKTDAILPPLGV